MAEILAARLLENDALDESVVLAHKAVQPACQ
jgi:hypothetical protein